MIDKSEQKIERLDEQLDQYKKELDLAQAQIVDNEALIEG